LRIAVVSPFVDRRHGTERAVAELLERLAGSYGCEVHLYAERVENLAITSGRAEASAARGAVFWHRVPALPGPQVIQFLVWLFLNRAARWWDTTFRALTFDLVLSPGINCFDADVVVVHVVFQRLQELWRQEVQDASTRPGILRRTHRRLYYSLIGSLEHRVYTRAQTSLATVSKRTADLLARYFQREGLRVVPYGVDTAQFSPSHRLARRTEARSKWNFRDDEFALLLIGNAWHSKGLDTVLHAMGALSHLPFRLMIVGSDATGAFREIAERLGVLDRCHWLAPDGDVLKFYAAADLYVGPSREDAFALPPLEAMACGLPVITSVENGGAQIISQGRNGFVLKDPGDSTALAELLRRFCMEPDLCREIGENASRTAREYTWERNAEGIWELLQETAAKKRQSSTLKP
jgi:glycosyltransferase involved in cell wall biosynthesis